jgi:hypothetical protein
MSEEQAVNYICCNKLSYGESHYIPHTKVARVTASNLFAKSPQPTRADDDKRSMPTAMVICAGTSDINVASEASVILQFSTKCKSSDSQTASLKTMQEWMVRCLVWLVGW